MTDDRTPAQQAYADIAPDFADLSDRVLLARYGNGPDFPGVTGASSRSPR